MTEPCIHAGTPTTDGELHLVVGQPLPGEHAGAALIQHGLQVQRVAAQLAEVLCGGAGQGLQTAPRKGTEK